MWGGIASLRPKYCPQIPLYLLLTCAIGHMPMASPQKVILSSENFRIFLNWTDPSDPPPDTEVNIRPAGEWLKLPNCSVPCDVTCEIESCYTAFGARVRSVSSQTNWTFSNHFNPFQHMVPGPPEVNVNVSQAFVNMSVHTKLSPCKRKVLQDCLIEVQNKAELWQADEKFMRSLHQDERIRISELPCFNCCVFAKSIFFEKESKYSAPVCFVGKEKGFQIEYSVITAFVAILVLTLGIAFIVWFRIPRPLKLETPASLDFTKITHFIPLTVDEQLETYQLVTVCHCAKSEEVTPSQTDTTPGRKETEQGNDWALTDPDTKSDDEDEVPGYTDSRWIPDGMTFDEPETQDDTRHQTLGTERHEQERSGDGQSQGTHLTEPNSHLTKCYFAISSPSNFSSVEFSCKRYNEQCKPLIFILDQGQEQPSQGDIPLSSLQIL
eukprot:gi/632954371/ref/XP_007892929.1/ PREDICTED: uncharacterized protein LOC103179445 [Callorhinchus milii]